MGTVLGHTCVVCEKTFPSRSGLENHKITHTGQKPYHCQVCFKTFSWKGNLKTHMAVHLTKNMEK